jgi:hypothetical protein
LDAALDHFLLYTIEQQTEMLDAIEAERQYQ